MQIFGAGVGRTGTLTLRTALDMLGFGPCHHMKVVLENPPHHVPLCEFLAADRPDEDFPRTNDRAMFWELVNEGTEKL